MLEINNLSTWYGEAQALHAISLKIERGEIVALIGSNGAGKSTTLLSIMNLLSSIEGEIVFEGKRINKIPTHEIVIRGLTLVPEGRRIFPNLTVKENLEMGAYLRYKEKSLDTIKEDMNKVFARFPRLKERINQSGYSMSGGEQQMLAIGRALMSRPKLLLLDEPSLGLAPTLVWEVADILEEINKEGTTILLVEQNALMALSLARRAYVLENGIIKMEGKTSVLKDNPQIKSAYLGGSVS